MLSDDSFFQPILLHCRALPKIRYSFSVLSCIALAPLSANTYIYIYCSLSLCSPPDFDTTGFETMILLHLLTNSLSQSTSSPRQYIYDETFVNSTYSNPLSSSLAVSSVHATSPYTVMDLRYHIILSDPFTSRTIPKNAYMYNHARAMSTC